MSTTPGGTKAEPLAYESTQSPGTALLTALLKTQAAVGFRIEMTGRNEYDKYDYATLEDVLGKVKQAALDNGLLIMCSVLRADSLPERTTRNGGREYAVEVTVETQVTHAETGKSLKVLTTAQGQDRADKAMLKAITAARKYGLSQLFSLATSADPEKDETVGTTSAAGTFNPDAVKGLQDLKAKLPPTPKPADTDEPGKGRAKSEDPEPKAEEGEGNGQRPTETMEDIDRVKARFKVMVSDWSKIRPTQTKAMTVACNKVLRASGNFPKGGAVNLTVSQLNNAILFIKAKREEGATFASLDSAD